MTTEIYSCKEGQSLKQGKLDYAADITTKAEAEADAKRRCAKDPSLKKIAYYKVSPDGDFRVFYSYSNPQLQAARPTAAKPTATKRAAPGKAKIAVKKGLWAKVKSGLGL